MVDLKWSRAVFAKNGKYRNLLKWDIIWSNFSHGYNTNSSVVPRNDTSLTCFWDIFCSKYSKQHGRLLFFEGEKEESLTESCGKVDRLGSRMGKWLGAPFSAMTILGFPRIITDPWKDLWSIWGVPGIDGIWYMPEFEISAEKDLKSWQTHWYNM